MNIWVDGDSCPKPVRDILCRASKRQGVPLFFVANRNIPVKKSQKINQILTSPEEGSADNYILDHAGPEDMIITRDIPLAAKLVEKELVVLNDRGTVYTRENVRERLAQRDFNQMLREAGLKDERSGNFGQKEIRAFSNAFDRTLQQMLLEERFRKTRS